tara:strand:- start:1262 stop:1528 length:267 start_codon:yes stop_codon:yes gene_type:complete
VDGNPRGHIGKVVVQGVSVSRKKESTIHSNVEMIRLKRMVCATINAQTRETKDNTNTTVFSIGANPRVRLASRRVSMLDGSAPRGLTV